MYEEFFGFSTHPFRNSPDPAFFYRSANHREALTMLIYGIREGKGFMLVTGDVGTGKTMLVQMLKMELGEKALVIEIDYPWVTPEDLIQELRRRVGADPEAGDSSVSLESLKRKLIELAEAGREVVLIIDEAHQLPVKTLEGIRLISNLETPSRKLLQIVLLGQEELNSVLAQYALRQVQQRIALSCHLHSLNAEESVAYVQHRLGVAGGNPAIISEGAARQVFDFAQGCPRVINQACDYCLLYAYGKFAHQVDDALAREALANLAASRPAALYRPAAPMTAASASASVAPSAPSSQYRPDALVSVIPGQERSAARADDLPPIRIPGAAAKAQAKAAAEERTEGQGSRLHWLSLLALLAGVLMMAGAAWWYFVNRPIDPTTAKHKSGETTLTESKRSSAAAPSVPEIDLHPGLALPAWPTEAAREVRVSPELSLALLASQQYGAWNGTVRDLVAAANPELRAVETIPPGTRLRLPTVSKPGMVTVDAKGRFFIYFASFENEDMARNESDLLSGAQRNAVVVAGLRSGTTTVYRVFIGPFETRAQSESTLGGLWFKYLPALGQN